MAAMTCVPGLGAATVLRGIWPSVVLAALLTPATIAFPRLSVAFVMLAFVVTVPILVWAIRRQAQRSRVAEAPADAPRPSPPGGRSSSA